MSSKTEQLKRLFEKIYLHDDQAAFAELFRLEYNRLYAFSLQYIGKPEEAEEVVNDVFLKLWKYRKSLLSINNPESYLFIAVKNQSLNYIKKYSTVHISLPDDGNTVTLIRQNSAHDDIEWKELEHKLNTAIDQLPDQCKKIFKLIKEEGFKTRHVAGILNISVRTVETQLYRSVRRLTQVLSIELPKKKKSRASSR